MKRKASFLASCLIMTAVLSVVAGTILALMDAAETAAQAKQPGTQKGRGSEYNFAGAIAINSMIAGIFFIRDFVHLF